MKDIRVTVWTNTQSHLTGTTSNTGPTIDLFATGAMVGGTNDATGLFGISVEIIQTFVSGTQSTDWTWETSTDNSTFVAGGFIGTVALTAAGNAKLRTNIESRARYVRLKASNSGTGATTSVAYPEDFGAVYGTRAIANG